MNQAIERSGIDPEQIDYVNAHATSTVIGDRAENNAMMRLFNPQKTKVSSTKSSIGHLLGAGAVESIFTLNAIKTGQVPATLNLDNVGQHEGDEQSHFKFDYVANKSITMDVNYAVCNSFDLVVSIVVYASQNTTIDKISKMRLVGEDKGGY